MKHAKLITIALVFAAQIFTTQLDAREPMPGVDVYKSPYCGCCGDWIAHLEKAGFVVKIHEVDDIDAARKQLGMPEKYASCHTAKITIGVGVSWLFEGHIPAADIVRFLSEAPDAIGLAVPGMPIGAPGMDTAAYGGRKDKYETLLILHDKTAKLYQRH
ncbi:hypothetical protein AGMMS50229_12660 [Campylobacterota bacterium]|nr:hypothetical protein AGMMS50229_12660 [Campylobacterota bacterium]